MEGCPLNCHLCVCFIDRIRALDSCLEVLVSWIRTDDQTSMSLTRVCNISQTVICSVLTQNAVYYNYNQHLDLHRAYRISFRENFPS